MNFERAYKRTSLVMFWVYVFLLFAFYSNDGPLPVYGGALGTLLIAIASLALTLFGVIYIGVKLAKKGAVRNFLFPLAVFAALVTVHSILYLKGFFDLGAI